MCLHSYCKYTLIYPTPNIKREFKFRSTSINYRNKYRTFCRHICRMLTIIVQSKYEFKENRFFV